MTWSFALLAAVIHLFTLSKARSWAFYLSKPLPVICFLVLASTHSETYPFAWLIALGLAFSAIGDVFLMQPKDRFIAGLVSFFIAHVAYGCAFWSLIEGSMTAWLPAVLFSAGIMVYLLLLPSLGKLKLPVAFYILVIVQMTWAAGAWWLQDHSLAAKAAFVGAIVFMVSDLVLAMDRFRSAGRYAQQILMTSYYGAQALITYSLVVY
ncbi:conserved hypothetical protein [Vibrio nigripulchritudo SOn1]|uniref:YhhN-like protein n=1 Tax=Vibrio nigripulchritudo SOn1 TaxID=1238450 RepID=A0AAV2VU59_9VIBR|nr:lysoplasmalogenase [Vibrio nigripulchritudo]CCO48162.1 conserved hypothetical protein [Vibrio nigripulchritudo SOn1]